MVIVERIGTKQSGLRALQRISSLVARFPQTHAHFGRTYTEAREQPPGALDILLAATS
jgi:hypothetical protein